MAHGSTGRKFRADIQADVPVESEASKETADNPSSKVTEDEPAIVIDLGSGMSRVGYAEDDEPKSVVHTVVGRPKFQSGASGGPTKVKASFVGENAYAQRGYLDISWPVERGVVTDWDDVEQIWQHMFSDLLKVDPENRKILLAESSRNSSDSREKMTQIMFEQFNISGLYLINQALLALYDTGRINGIVIDCGYGLTQIVPVQEGYVYSDGVITSNLAGNDLTQYLTDMLSKKGSCSFTAGAVKDDVDEIKKMACCVAKNFDQELRETSMSSNERSYDLPQGQVLKRVKLGGERIKCPEILFKPYLAGVDSTGIHEKIYHSITKCPADFQKILYQNIVVCGGSTLLPGFLDRLEKEIKVLVAQDTPIKLIAPPNRAMSTWTGGSILGSLSTFAQMWIGKQEYDEHGPNIVHRKCL